MDQVVPLAIATLPWDFCEEHMLRDLRRLAINITDLLICTCTHPWSCCSLIGIGPANLSLLQEGSLGLGADVQVSQFVQARI
ncbi:hypothetical protein BS78_01G303300 [Paspalum vaginatum]|nr:hypothetical protein BS78_01G303300 [Paspalum vaginatum]